MAGKANHLEFLLYKDAILTKKPFDVKYLYMYFQFWFRKLYVGQMAIKFETLKTDFCKIEGLAKSPNQKHKFETNSKKKIQELILTFRFCL